ncbi:hypothetical protein [Paenibacillus senegalensis]|uniref:hypothetical protein n=1 Tax=Paenibacillus senegalensis TaxID=1465766 RepID=UPI000288F067|nr:hypothetical protein [Paenibacillus senegalensis]
MNKQAGLHTTISIFALIVLLLASCGAPRSETIIMDDTESPAAEEEDAPFTVQTIYSILEGTESDDSLDKELDTVHPLGWLDTNSLLSLAVRYRYGEVYLGRINEPYVAVQNLHELHTAWKHVPLSGVVLSPDRSYVSYINRVGQALNLHLYSLEDGGNKQLEATIDEHTFNMRMSWSNNSRFLSFVSGNESRALQLHVYDSKEDSMASYTLPVHQDGYLTFAAVSNNGEEAVIVKRSLQHSVLEWGSLEEGTFTAHYRHPINDEGWVEWLHDDQIAFVGADNTLYSYDQRNGLLSIVLTDIQRFRLSADRKLIAYTQGDDLVYAGRIYGNNVVQTTPIYRGIDAYHMVWGPDNSKLLVSGPKYHHYQRPMDPRALDPKPAEPRAQDFIETLYYQNLVIEFK